MKKYKFEFDSADVKSLAFLLIVAILVGFLITSGLVWVASWAFGFTFTWKIALGSWVCLLLLKAVLSK